MQSLEKLLKKGKPVIMGVLNLTPDSFSDGGMHNSIKKALTRAKQMEKEGADIIDIGGESSGPGSKNIKLKEEEERVLPVLKELRKKTKLLISIDTYKAKLADKALKEGANIINDVTGLRGDRDMAEIIAKHKCPVIIMYSKDKTARTTVKKKKYTDVIATIEKFFKQQIKKHGIKKSQIIIDPGMGQFISAIPKYSYEILARLGELKKLRYPILVGVSRKSFLGGGVESREKKGLVANAIAYLNGASIIRTHDIEGTKKFLDNLNK